MKAVLYLMILLTTICCTNGDHFVFGNVVDRVKVAKHKLVEYKPIPFLKRVKYFIYTQLNGKTIQGIQARDTMHSKSSVNITAGGVGYPFVSLRMKSERGRGLSYDINIYVNADYV